MSWYKKPERRRNAMLSFKAYPSSSTGNFAFGAVMSLLGVVVTLTSGATYIDNRSWVNLLWLILVIQLTASYIYGTVKIVREQHRSTAYKRIRKNNTAL